MSHTELRLVEPPRMRPPAHGAAEWDMLLATKLHAPNRAPASCSARG